MKGKAATQAPATATVTRHFYQGKSKLGEGVKDSNETLEVRSFVTAPAEVGVTFGLTVNLGNFKSARVDVSLKLPCYVEEADAAYDHAEQWVQERVKREVQEAISYSREQM